jgi:hypothetical protein
MISLRNTAGYRRRKHKQNDEIRQELNILELNDEVITIELTNSIEQKTS